MVKSKKIILIIIIVLVLLIVLAIVALNLLPALNVTNTISNVTGSSKDQEKSSEELEFEFLNSFTNIDYSETDQDVVIPMFEYEASQENKYEINVHIPKINFETCKSINDEILETFGRKVLEIVNDPDIELTKYNVDYLSYFNDGVISLVIKCTLKEGSNPQRIIIKTCNYNVNEEKLLTFKDVINEKNLDELKIQEQINNVTRIRNTNTQESADQGYNVYVRDLSSSEYEIANIDSFYINNEGEVYILFAYGNKNFTETIDVIKVN